MDKDLLTDIEIIHSLSDYDEEDAKKLSEIGEYVSQFFEDYKTIYSVDKIVANRLLKDFDSQNRVVSAEARIIAEKAEKAKKSGDAEDEKATVEIIEISVTSSDAYYLQLKTGGISVRQEIKSVTRDKATDIDKEIINAEYQHKAKLKGEKGEPTWHKTTVVIGSDKNPWPFSKMEDLKHYREKTEDKILRQAEYRIKRIVLGAVVPKSKGTPLKEIYIKQLLAAEREREAFGNRKIKAPKKGGMKKPGGLRESLKAYKKEEKSIKKAKKKSKKIEERLRRQLLVTERVSIVNPYQGFTITLDRQEGGQFEAHFKKCKAIETTEVKHNRRHWDEPEGFRTKHIQAVPEEKHTDVEVLIKDGVKLN